MKTTNPKFYLLLMAGILVSSCEISIDDAAGKIKIVDDDNDLSWSDSDHILCTESSSWRPGSSVEVFIQKSPKIYYNSALPQDSGELDPGHNIPFDPDSDSRWISVKQIDSAFQDQTTLASGNIEGSLKSYGLRFKKSRIDLKLYDNGRSNVKKAYLVLEDDMAYSLDCSTTQMPTVFYGPTGESFICYSEEGGYNVNVSSHFPTNMVANQAASAEICILPPNPYYSIRRHISVYPTMMTYQVDEDMPIVIDAFWEETIVGEVTPENVTFDGNTIKLTVKRELNDRKDFIGTLRLNGTSRQVVCSNNSSGYGGGEAVDPMPGVIETK